MSRAEAYVTFSTSGKKGFSWPDGFGHVSDDEIAALRCECQWALSSLDVECARRKEDAEYASITDLVETIERNATQIQQMGALSVDQTNIFVKSKTFLEDLSPKMEMQSKKYKDLCKELCWQVSRWTNVWLTLLLIVSFGRKKLIKFAPPRAMALLSYLQHHQDSLTDRVRGVLTARVMTRRFEGITKEDNGPLALVNTTNLIDAGTTSHDRTARASSMKQPGLQLQEACAMNPPCEGGSLHIWQQAPQVLLDSRETVPAETGSHNCNDDVVYVAPVPKKRKHAHSEQVSRRDSPAPESEGTAHTEFTLDVRPDKIIELWKLQEQSSSQEPPSPVHLIISDRYEKVLVNFYLQRDDAMRFVSDHGLEIIQQRQVMNRISTEIASK